MKAWRSSRFFRFAFNIRLGGRPISLPLVVKLMASSVVSVVLIGGTLGASLPTHAEDLPPDFTGGNYAAGEILVGWGTPEKQATAIPASGDQLTAWSAQAAASLAEQTQLTVLPANPVHGLYRLLVPAGQELAEAARVAGLPGVRFAEPNYAVFRLQQGSPQAFLGDPTSEPLYQAQWNLARIETPSAWSMTTGSRSVIVAVLDTGIDFSHPEFAGRLVAGADYVEYDGWPADDEGHGTFVASIIVAAANGVGMTGVSPAASIMPIKVLNSAGYGYKSASSAAIYWAVDHGARIINMSLGGPSVSTAEREAVTYASQHNVLIVASTGSCATSGADRICFGYINPRIYPAAYPEALAVGATDRNDLWGGYSNYGPWVDLVAPGGTSGSPLIGALIGGGYRLGYGTSVSAPTVSGAAALILSLAPDTSQSALVELLTGTADKVDSFPYVEGRNDYLGYGRLNVGRAVSQVPCSGCRGWISGLLWLDENGDGLRGAGEPAVSGHRVCAEPLAHRISACVESAGDGSYRIGVRPASYFVAADPTPPAGRDGQWGFRASVGVWPDVTTEGVDIGFKPSALAPATEATPAGQGKEPVQAGVLGGAP